MASQLPLVPMCASALGCNPFNFNGYCIQTLYCMI